MTVHLFLSGKTADDRTKEHQQEHEDADAAYEVAVTDEERPAAGKTDLAFQGFLLPPGSTFDYPSCRVDDRGYSGVAASCDPTPGFYSPE